MTNQEERLCEIITILKTLEEEKKSITSSLFIERNDYKGTKITATYIKPAESCSYDKSKLETMFGKKALEPCKKVSIRKGYHRISFIKQKKADDDVGF